MFWLNTRNVSVVCRSKAIVRRQAIYTCVPQQTIYLCVLFRTTSPTNSSNLPECDSKGPHIKGSGELASCDALNGHPLDGQSATGLLHINLLNLPRETKVSDLQELVLSNEDITASQVTVNNIQTGQILL